MDSPAHTHPAVARGLAMLRTKRELPLRRKHGNSPL
jgi:hypothetical protein